MADAPRSGPRVEGTDVTGALDIGDQTAESLSPSGEKGTQ